MRLAYPCPPSQRRQLSDNSASRIHFNKITQHKAPPCKAWQPRNSCCVYPLLLQGNTVHAKHARRPCMACISKQAWHYDSPTRKGAHQSTKCPGMIQNRMPHLMQHVTHKQTRPANRLSHAPKLGNLSACTGQPGTCSAACASHHSISSNAWRVCTHTVDVPRNE